MNSTHTINLMFHFEYQNRRKEIRKIKLEAIWDPIEQLLLAKCSSQSVDKGKSQTDHGI